MDRKTHGYVVIRIRTRPISGLPAQVAEARIILHIHSKLSQILFLTLAVRDRSVLVVRGED